MNILFIGHNASYSGAPKSLLRIMRYIKSKELGTFECLLRNDGPLMSEYEEVCTLHSFLPAHLIPKEGAIVGNLYRKMTLRQHRAKLLSHLKDQNFDVIYCNTVVNANVLEFLAPLGLPVVAHLREMHTAIDSYGGREMIDLLDRYVNKYIAVSKTAGNVLSEYGVDGKKVNVIYNFLEHAEIEKRSTGNHAALRESLGIAKTDVVVGNVGTLNSRKGGDLFVETAQKVFENHPEAHFVWVGGGTQEEVTDMLSSWSDEQRKKVHLVGEIPHPYDHYQMFDVLLLTSRDDPFPLTAMEAAFFRKPVVCIGGTGGIPEVLKDPALVVPEASSASLAEGLIPLLSDESKRKDWGNQCHKILIEELSIDKQMEKVLDIVRSVLK